MTICKKWFLLSHNVSGGVEEEEITRRKKNNAEIEGHILTPPKSNLTHIS